MKTGPIINVLASPYPAIAKVVATIGLVFMLERTGSEIMDISTLMTPEPFYFAILAICIPISVLVSASIAKRSYEETLKKKNKSKQEMPYELDYLLGTIVGASLAIVAGLLGSGLLIGYLGVTGVPAIGYAIVAAAISGILSWAFVSIVHLGIETWIKNAKKIIDDITGNLPGLIESVDKAQDALKPKDDEKKDDF